MQNFTKSFSQGVLLLLAFVSISTAEVFAQATTISGQVDITV